MSVSTFSSDAFQNSVVASATLPPAISPDVRVRGVIRVSMRTMSFGCIDGRYADAAANVLLLRNSFKVTGPHAMANTTEMVKLQASRDWPLSHFVTETMGEDLPVPIMEFGIPVTGNLPSPQPAGLSLVDLWPEAISRGDTGDAANCILIRHREPILSVVTGRDVHSVAAPLYFTRNEVS